MADYSNPGGGGGSGMYADVEDSAPAGAKGQSGDQGGQPALLPKSILAGKKFNVGDELVVKIDAIYDDQIAVSYATEKADQEKPQEYAEEGGEQAGGGGQPAGSEMASMME